MAMKFPTKHFKLLKNFKDTIESLMHKKFPHFLQSCCLEAIAKYSKLKYVLLAILSGRYLKHLEAL